MGVLRRLHSRQPAAATEDGSNDDPQLALIQRAGRGDQAAFADLYDATAALVHGIVLKVVREPSHAE
jgi:RNA polymerase sigma-70 factor (ECF subfamily)